MFHNPKFEINLKKKKQINECQEALKKALDARSSQEVDADKLKAQFEQSRVVLENQSAELQKLTDENVN